MSILELQRLMPAPSRPAFVPTESEWQAAETALGIALPDDYKTFLNTYGSGRIDDFFGIFSPAPQPEPCNLINCWREQREVFEYMQNGPGPLSIDLYPAKPGLLPIGQTDNGDMIFYVIRGESNVWTVAVLESRGWDVELFDLGLVDFLCAALRHEHDALPAGLKGVFERERVASHDGGPGAVPASGGEGVSKGRS